MKFRIPSQPGLSRMRSIKNDAVMPILFDDTDLDRMFTLLFERCVKKGKLGPSRKKKDFEIGGELNLDQNLIPSLSKNLGLVGFDSDDGREILLNWVKTSTLEFTTEGKTKRGEQIDYMKFLTIATYRSGLPRSENRSSTRKIDETVYRSLISFVSGLPECEKPLTEIHERVTATSIARGVDFEPLKQPWSSPVYNEKDQVDINTLLQLRLLEHFEAKVVHVKKAKNSSEDSKESKALVIPFSEPLDALARDFFNITTVFSQRSATELLSMYKSIFCLRLYRLPIILSNNLSAAAAGLDKPVSQHEMFFDFTKSRKSASYRLANESVLSDLNATSTLIYHLIFLRESLEMVKKSKDRLQEYSELSPDEQIAYLFDFSNSESAKDKSYDLIEEMKQYFASKEGEGQEALEIIESCVTDDYFESLMSLILMDVEDRGLKSIKKWLYSVGGLKQSMTASTVSVLAGDKKSMKTWHYSMSDSVLNTLLHLCFVRANGSVINRKELELSEVLNSLRAKFGILIDVPPMGFDSPEHFEAASQNFTAFKARIKQLGWFEGLSDDFEAQYISKPAGDMQ